MNMYCSKCKNVQNIIIFNFEIEKSLNKIHFFHKYHVFKNNYPVTEY